MKSMTVRGIDPELAEKLKQAAAMQGKSVNQLVVETIRNAFGTGRKKRFKRTHDDLDHLFGKWSQAEFDRIQAKIEQERVIDDELWS